MEKVSKLSKHAFIHQSLFFTDAMELTTSSLLTVISLAMMNCHIDLFSEINLFLLKLLLFTETEIRRGQEQVRSQIQVERGSPAKGSGFHIWKFQSREEVTCCSLQQVSSLPLQPVSSLTETHCTHSQATGPTYELDLAVLLGPVSQGCPTSQRHFRRYLPSPRTDNFM